MPEFLSWIEASALGAAMRGAGVWAYAIVNLLHILGIATLFGSILVLDLRLLGAWRSIPIGVIARPTVPLAAAGFVLAAVAGVALIATNGREYIGNPFLSIKFPAIAAGLINVLVLHRLPAWRARESTEPGEQARRQLAWAGGLSLASWIVAIAAGRMIGYW